MRVTLPIYLLVFASFSQSSSLSAEILDFGGYAVANHSPCGLNNLPATTRELEKKG